MLSGGELQVLDDFRFEVADASRAAAVRELLKRGLAAEGFQVAAFGVKSEDRRPRPDTAGPRRITAQRSPIRHGKCACGRGNGLPPIDLAQDNLCRLDAKCRRLGEARADEDQAYASVAMPYRQNADLPPSVRGHLPDHAQDVYRETFNHAYGQLAGERDREQARRHDRLVDGQAHVCREDSGGSSAERQRAHALPNKEGPPSRTTLPLSGRGPVAPAIACRARVSR